MALPPARLQGKLQIVVGGQFGSEGKGAIAAHLAAKFGFVTAVRVAGPNAGHTVIGRCPKDCDRSCVGHAWKLQQIPVAAVSNPSAKLIIAPGSEVHLPTLLNEIDSLDSAGYAVSDRLGIDPFATMLEAHHSQQEAAYDLTARVGSTGKGVGAARSDRVHRVARLAQEEPAIDDWIIAPGYIQDSLRHGNDVQIEGTQGYGLGQHAGFYPYCTSSDCTAIDFMAMAGVSPWTDEHLTDLEIWVVFRAYPIRVAGNSGPLFNETTWETLDLPVEYTTVTNRPRRVGHWDGNLAKQAMIANGYPSRAVHVALTMADHVWPHLAGATDPINFSTHVWNWIHHHAADTMVTPTLIGTGPSTVIELPHEGRAHP